MWSNVKKDHEQKEDFTNVVKEEVIPDSDEDIDDLDYEIRYQPKGAEKEKKNWHKGFG